MNKAIVPLLALGGVASAASTISYNDMDQSIKDNTVASYSFDTAGTPDVKADNYSLTVWGQSPQLGAFTTEDGVAILKSGQQDPYQLNFTAGVFGTSLTISFDLVSLTNSTNWASVVTLYSGDSNDGSAGWKNGMSLRNTGNGANGTLVLSTADGGEVGFEGSSTAKWLNTGIAINGGAVNKVVTVVSDAATSTLSLYIDGELAGSVDNWTPKTLTGISFSGTLGGGNQIGEAKIDNLLIVGSALTADQVKSIVTPEPATATLSLLALAGLAARRRRH